MSQSPNVCQKTTNGSFRLHKTIVNREKNLGGEFSEKRSIGGLRLLLYWNYG
jgi:hypothetical protein